MRNRRAWALLIALIAAPQSHADDQRSPSVGVAARIDQLVLPGPELEARPLRDRESPIVLRVAETYPHGSDFRYDLVYYGLDPGRYDLRDYLQRKDGSSAAGLPPIPVEIRAVLPPGQIEPNRLVIERAPSLGGYRLLLGAAGFAWIAGLAAILLAGKRRHALAAAAARPLTLADRLRPLVEAARHGALEPGQHAELERMLIGYWRRRLGLADASHARAIAVMREHPEAGPLLRALEDWLHRPGHADAVDVGDLLEPYRDLPADALEAEPAPAAAGREA
jgi:hypothetical protein